MEGEPARRAGAGAGPGGGRRIERACSREEGKRREPPGAQRPRAGRSAAAAAVDPHDDRSSAASGLDVGDRLTYLEQRMQMQEDEIQLLKMALADVLKRLNISEEHQAASANSRRSSGTKARPVSLALPSRSPLVTSCAASVKKSSTLPSSSTARNYSPTPPRSGARSPAGSVKDSPCKTPKRPTSAASTGRKPPESSRPKEAAGTVGTRQVTHCKVTMQIYLSPLTRRTGSSEAPGSGAAVPARGGPTAAPDPPQDGGDAKPEAKKATNPSFTVNLQKTTTNQSAPRDPSSYKSPLKSPSQYFQICY